MTSDAEIRNKQIRIINVFRERPDAARSTASASAVICDGLACTFRQGDQTATMDLPEIMGGADAGPTPGFFGRAGICGCVSIGIKQTAIIEEMTLRRVTVGIENDFDDAAGFGIGDNSAAPLETRLFIEIETDEPEDRVRDLVQRVLERDTWFLALRDAQKVSTTLSVNG